MCDLRANVGVTYRHSVAHSWQTDVGTIASHLPHGPGLGFETLHKQWLLLLVVHHPICHIERVPKSGIFGVI